MWHYYRCQKPAGVNRRAFLGVPSMIDSLEVLCQEGAQGVMLYER
jgi:hypothetical protein